MSLYVKSAAAVAIFLVLRTVLRILGVFDLFSGIATTGSGGLGAVSFGLSELLVEFFLLTGIVWAVIFWRSRRYR